MKESTEVLICGAGPVGLACAWQLGNAGMQVTVIDMAPGVLQSPRALAHHGPTYRAFLELGLGDDLANRAYVGGQVGRHMPDMGLFAAFDHPGCYIGQDDLCEIWCRRLAQLPNVQLRWNVSLQDLQVHPQRVEAVLDAEGRVERLACRWLIGADGARSTVRKLRGIPFEGHTWDEQVYAANVDFDFSTLGMAAAQFRCQPDSWAVIIRIDADSGWRIAFADEGGPMAVPDLEHARRRLREFMPEGAEFNVLRLAPYRVHQRAAKAMRDGPVFLIGDAAHITAPWGGFGLTTGLWDAFVLGDLLPEVVAGRMGDAALDRFSAERLRVYWEVTSPGATENRRILRERDPARRLADWQAFEALAASPERQAKFERLFQAFVGDPILSVSRWRAAHAI